VELNANARALREARSLVSVTELGERAARERLRVMLDRSRERVALPKDLLQAQVSLAEAGHDYQDALLAYWDARADYEKVTGEDPR
jgi:outer membrane protein